jgi:hypothetical protein
MSGNGCGIMTWRTIFKGFKMSVGKTVLKILKGVAPTLAMAIPGPFGGLAAKFLADQFTDGDTGKVEDYILGASPEQLKQVKLADLDFKVALRELDIAEEQLHAGDRDSARSMAASTSTTPQVIMSAVYTVGYFGTLYMFMTGHIAVPAAYASMFTGMLGVLSAAQIQIINFWFGSSSGSKQKTAAMSNGRAS